MSLICYLLVLLPLFCHLVDGMENKCGNGWIYHDNQCYIFRNEYERYHLAKQTCGLFGGHLAYAYDEKSLAFLIEQVKLRSKYASWYGIQIDSYDHKLEIDSKEMPDSFIRPKVKQLTEPTTGCIALLKDDSVYTIDFLLISTPCQVKLPYACRGEPSLIPNSVLSDKDHIVVASSLDVYWFSNILDKRTYKDAQKACIEKSMTLISVRDKASARNISMEMSFRQQHSVDPWWIGLSVTDGVYSWTSGVGVQPSILQWKRYTDSSYQYHPDCRILLEEGTMDERDCYSTNAPFICARSADDTGTFRCPPKWIRAGQSCYYYGNTLTISFRHTHAQDFCAKLDSHLVSIDTLEEKIWLLDSSLFKENNYRSIWTSLNDKKTLNDFRWANGEKASTEVLDIRLGYFDKGNGKCFSYQPAFKYLYSENCEADRFPGCQYKSLNGQCVSNNWAFINGYCYFIPQHIYSYLVSKYINERVPYPSMLQKCYADVVQYDSSILVQPLKIDGKDVINFLSNQSSTMWIGLTEKERGVYQWADGSTADMSLFDKTSGRNNNSTDRCFSMDNNGKFMLRSCDSDVTPEPVCEKEIPYHHTD